MKISIAADVAKTKPARPEICYLGDYVDQGLHSDQALDRLSCYSSAIQTAGTTEAAPIHVGDPMRFLCLAVSLLPLAAQAGELPADASLQLLVWGENAPVDVGRDYLFDFGEGTLAERAAQWNAPIREEGRGDLSYACVTDGQWAAWMLSDMSDQAGEPMLTAIVETKAPTADLGCTVVPELDLMSSSEDGAGIGVTVSDLDDRIDLENINDNGLVALRSRFTAGDDGASWDVIRTITYHVAEDGSIDGVAYEVATVQ